MYTLHREQIIAATLDEAWQFMQNPANLNRITPDNMDFQIVSDVPQQMSDGLMIEYSVRIPFIGRQRWVSEILEVDPPHFFVDEQRIGPYKYWRHEHKLEETPGGVRVTDHVTYQPPFGPIGKLVHALYIKRELNRIFVFRCEKMKQLFGER